MRYFAIFGDFLESIGGEGPVVGEERIRMEFNGAVFDLPSFFFECIHCFGIFRDTTNSDSEGKLKGGTGRFSKIFF